MVYAAPVLQYYASHKGSGEVSVVGPIFWNQEYGFALQPNSVYREALNRILLRMMEDGEYQDLHNEWFGSEGRPQIPS